MKLREVIQRARLAQGLGPNELARLAGIDNAHLIRFERGEKGMSDENLDKLAVALGLPLDRLLAGEHGTPTGPENPLTVPDFTVPDLDPSTVP